MGRIIILIGAGLILVGLIIQYFPDAFKWFGNLPGDFKKTDGDVKIYFPITSMILISILLNGLFKLIKHFY